MSHRSSGALNGPVRLERNHDRGSFSCGNIELDDFLKRYARQNQDRGAGVTYGVTRSQRVVGYYTLSAGSVSTHEPPARLTKGLGGYPVPVILLARLAVDADEKGRGLGAALLKDAMRRAVQGADAIGAVALLVHAKDDGAARFYRHFGFEPSTREALHLYLPMCSIKAILDEQ